MSLWGAHGLGRRILLQVIKNNLETPAIVSHDKNSPALADIGHTHTMHKKAVATARSGSTACGVLV